MTIPHGGRQDLPLREPHGKPTQLHLREQGEQEFLLRATKHPRRIHVPGLPYYVTVAFFQRKSIFREPTFARLFLQILDTKRSAFHFLVHGHVLMPDHYHMIVTPPPERAVSDVLRHVNGVFAQEYNHSTGHQGQVWQRNFWDHGIRNEQDFKEKLDYIHMNPVRAGLVGNPEDYPWSSAGWYAEKHIEPFSLDPIIF